MLPKELDHEDGELTATQKVKRSAIADMFGDLVDDMYRRRHDGAHPMSVLLETTVSGLALGAVYALLGLGFVIIYRATDVVSFAQPALMIFGAYFTVYFATVMDLNFWISVPLAAVVGAVAGAVIERLLLRPLVGRPPFAAVMVTIGVDIILRVITHDLIGLEQRRVGDPFGLQTFAVGGFRISQSDRWSC
jgi:branched-chain amino acid transport system permease protein